MRGGERFYSQGWHPSQVFPYKEKSVGYSGGWCPRAPCGYLIGPGCRGSVSGSLASLRNFVCGIFPGHASTCPTFHYGKSCYKHLHLGFCMDMFPNPLRQEYWSGLSFPFPGDLPNPGIAQVFSTSGRFFTIFTTRYLTNKVGKNCTLIILRFSIHEQEISFHLFISSLISFIRVL